MIKKLTPSSLSPSGFSSYLGTLTFLFSTLVNNGTTISSSLSRDSKYKSRLKDQSHIQKNVNVKIEITYMIGHTRTLSKQ